MVPTDLALSSLIQNSFKYINNCYYRVMANFMHFMCNKMQKCLMFFPNSAHSLHYFKYKSDQFFLALSLLTFALKVIIAEISRFSRNAQL